MLDFSTDAPGADAREQVSVARCKLSPSPHDYDDIPKCCSGGADKIRARPVQETFLQPCHSGSHFRTSSTNRVESAPAINRSEIEVESWPWCTRRIEWDPLGHLGNEKSGPKLSHQKIFASSVGTPKQHHIAKRLYIPPDVDLRGTAGQTM